MTVDSALLRWMLETDPALRWRVERDLAGASEEIWRATQARVATEGFGARLLALQDADGQWAGGAFFPANFDFKGPEAAAGAGQPWTATTWSLNTLREWGVDATALAGTTEKLAANSRWEYDESLTYWQGEVDCCINAYTLANGAWLGADVSGIARWFLEHQLSDGGWNCEWDNGSTRSSFHSTLNSLKGILYWEQATGGTDELRDARAGAEDYLLKRKLMNRLSTGEPVGQWVTRFTYPFRWRYSALRAVDYFREATIHDRITPDERLADAIETIRSQRQLNGAWLQADREQGRVWFDVDVAAGEASPWLTYYATKVLDWWHAARS